MTYDDWKTSPPEPEEEDDRLHCTKSGCGYIGDAEEFSFINEDGDQDTKCPACGCGGIETMADREERLRADYWQQKLDEKRGK